MKNLFLILFFSISAFGNAQNGCGIKGRVVLKGTYVDQNFKSGLPVDSVLVHVIYNGSIVDSVMTDSLGEYEIKKSLPAGIYVLKLEKQGFNQIEYKGVILSNNCITYMNPPPTELVPIGYKEPKQKKVTEKKTSHKKKHHY